jgi:microcystin-dependent protein
MICGTTAWGADPFLAEIVMFGGNFAPRGWAFCDGQLLPIASYSALFSLLGTTYGGDGRTTFALPDMRGRVPMGPRTGPGLSTYSLGQRGGAERVVLNVNEMPGHSHVVTLMASSSNGNQTGPTGHVLANDPREDQYSDAAPNVSMSAGAILVDNAGGGQSHYNLQPFLCVNFIIALQGVFPSRN